jgi:hypothetical protein
MRRTSQGVGELAGGPRRGTHTKGRALGRSGRLGGLAAVVVFAALALLAAFGATSAGANGVPFSKGDLIAGNGNGTYKHFDGAGKLLDTLETTSGAPEDTGMCFDAKGNLFTTNFGAQSVSKFDSGGNLLLASFGSGFNADPESCVVTTSGDILVGQADGSHEVLKFDPAGNLLASYAPETEDRGTDWIDLSSDQCTLHYTSEGSAIKAFNICTNEQLPDFATGLPAPCYAHRILSDGGELVACTSEVARVNSKGEVIQTYTPGGSLLFALNLDSDGTSFWTADLFSGEIWKIDIATGTVLEEFNSEPAVDVAGLAVVGELTCSESEIKVTPASAEKEVGTSYTATATVRECGKPVVGTKVKFKVTGANPREEEVTTNGSGEAQITYVGTNAGTDTVTGTFTNASSEEETSSPVTVTWTKESGPTCMKVVGEASGTVNKERQRAVNNLSTNLLEKQSFTFTWENGLEKVTLDKLTSASCVVTSGGRRKFSGKGTASYDGEEGYTVQFAISVTNKGVDEVVMRLFEGKEKVASFKFATKAAETIS